MLKKDYEAPEYVTVNEDGNVTLTLAHPVEHNKETVSAVTLRTAMTVRDLEAMDGVDGQVARNQRLLRALSVPALSIEAIRKMQAVDFHRLVRLLDDIGGN